MKLNRDIIIAVDGFSSCGKSTFAKLIAKELGYIFIDSGAMYRAVALFSIRNNFKINSLDTANLISKISTIKIHFKYNNEGVLNTFLNDENVEKEIRGVAVSQKVSEISKIKQVREYLVSMQQSLGSKKKIVMDGRDIGTVVFPDAEIKIYMQANTDVRAERRYKELIEKGVSVTFDDIKKNIEERDFNDLNRSESPLKKANDAVLLDNSYMSIEEQFVWFKKLIIEMGLLYT